VKTTTNSETLAAGTLWNSHLRIVKCTLWNENILILAHLLCRTVRFALTAKQNNFAKTYLLVEKHVYLIFVRVVFSFTCRKTLSDKQFKLSRIIPLGSLFHLFFLLTCSCAADATRHSWLLQYQTRSLPRSLTESESSPAWLVTSARKWSSAHRSWVKLATNKANYRLFPT